MISMGVDVVSTATQCILILGQDKLAVSYSQWQQFSALLDNNFDVIGIYYLASNIAFDVIFIGQYGVGCYQCQPLANHGRVSPSMSGIPAKLKQWTISLQCCVLFVIVLMKLIPCASVDASTLKKKMCYKLHQSILKMRKSKISRNAWIHARKAGFICLFSTWHC